MSSSSTFKLSSADRRRSLAAVIAASFSVGIAFGIGFPLTALTLEAWGEPKWMIGLAGAAPAIAILFALPILPWAIRKLGAVTAMTGGAILAGLGFLALAFVNDGVTWIVVRLVMSIGLAGPWLAGETWINLVARDETRGRVIALYAMAFFTGFALGPLVLSTFGTTGITPFLIGAVGTVVACLPIIVARNLAPDLSQRAHHNAFSAVHLAPIGMVCAFMSGFAETSYLSLIPNVGLAAGLDEARAIGLLSLITIGGIALQFPLGWLSDKISRLTVTFWLATLFVALSIALPFVLRMPLGASLLVLLLGGVILGFYSVGLMIVGEVVEPHNLAVANAGFLVLYQLGSIVGPATAGAAMTYSPVFGFVATVCVLMLISGAVLWRLSSKPLSLRVADPVADLDG